MEQGQIHMKHTLILNIKFMKYGLLFVCFLLVWFTIQNKRCGRAFHYPIMIQNQRQLEGRNELSLEEEYICSYFVEEFLVFFSYWFMKSALDNYPVIYVPSEAQWFDQPFPGCSRIYLAWAHVRLPKNMWNSVQQP